jgi:hypothetical protein
LNTRLCVSSAHQTAWLSLLERTSQPLLHPV